MLHIRKASKEDITAINQLAQVVFPETYKAILTGEQIAYMLDWMYSPANLAKQMEEGHHYYLAYNAEQMVGYLSVEKEQDTIYHLQKIYLMPQFQGCGYGKALFLFAKEEIKRLDEAAKEMHLNVNRHNQTALAFYQRMGMHCIAEGDFEIGNGYQMNDYVMSIAL